MEESKLPPGVLTANHRTRLMLLTASPMHYQVPLYRMLASDPSIAFQVVFASRDGLDPHDGGFGQEVSWDVDLLGGYDHQFLDRAHTNGIGGGFASLRDTDIVSALRQEDPHVLWLHGYNYLTLQLAGWLQKVRRRPLFVREEQTLLHPRSIWKRATKQVALRAFLSSTTGLYIGGANREWFQHYGVAENRLFHVPYCVDNDFFRGQAVALRPLKKQLRTEFGIQPDSGPVILTAARLIPKKNIKLLISAYAELRRSHAANLLIVGSGEEELGLRRLALDLNVPDIYWAGFLNQSQISRAYAASDIFVLPSSRDETWGLVVNEAMNFQLPVVVSDSVGCSRDMVIDGWNGNVFPSNDKNALANKLASLLRDPQRRIAFGQAASQHILGWNYEKAAAGVIAAVRHATNRDAQGNLS